MNYIVRQKTIRILILPNQSQAPVFFEASAPPGSHKDNALHVRACQIQFRQFQAACQYTPFFNFKP